jgi:RNA polymerase sigma-70 factor (ECF subfamily)
METSSTLLKKVRDTGDPESWREFLNIYKPLIVSYARRRGLSEAEAEDATQDVFVRILKALPTFELDRGRGRFRTWLWQVTSSAIVDRARREGRRVHAEKVWGEGHDGSEPRDQDEWFTLFHRRVLECALRRVRSETRPLAWACFEEHVLKRRPASEVAADLGTTVNAVYVSASRVLGRLRERCAESMGELSDDPDDLPGRR